MDTVDLLVTVKDFDPDVQVYNRHFMAMNRTEMIQDASGWTPLMVASSLPEGDMFVDILLQKGADVNIKSKENRLVVMKQRLIEICFSGQVLQAKRGSSFLVD